MKNILKLVSIMLKDYSDVLSNNGCNDTTDEMNNLIEQIGVEKIRKIITDWNGGSYDGGEENYDWIIAGALSEYMKTLDTKEDFAIVSGRAKCNHKKKNLNYVGWHEFAEAQIKRGIKQTQCNNCGLWLFPSEQ